MFLFAQLTKYGLYWVGSEVFVKFERNFQEEDFFLSERMPKKIRTRNFKLSAQKHIKETVF